jgi:chemotaxis protein MotB
MNVEIDEGESGGGAPAWMTTYSDLATLLLTFFVLLLSLAQMDVMNFKVVLGSVQDALGVQKKVRGDYSAMVDSMVSNSPIQRKGVVPNADMTVHKNQAKQGAGARVAAKMDRFIKLKGFQSSIEVQAMTRGVALRARNQVLFKVGSADLMPEGEPVLGVVSDLFEEFVGDLSIQGHTDNVPIKTDRFPSNWELSTARAISVMRFLTTKRGASVRRLEVAGYADSRPVDESGTVESKQRNRRVEFIFLYPVKNGKVRPDLAFRVSGKRPAKAAPGPKQKRPAGTAKDMGK